MEIEINIGPWISAFMHTGVGLLVGYACDAPAVGALAGAVSFAADYALFLLLHEGEDE